MNCQLKVMDRLLARWNKTANFLFRSAGKDGLLYHYLNPILMEPQHYPNSPNHDNLLIMVLKPEQLLSKCDHLSFWHQLISR